MGALRDLGRGLVDQLRRLLATPRYLVILAILLGASWLTQEVYADRVVLHAPIRLIDEDGSHLSRMLSIFLSASREIRIVNQDFSSSDGDHEALLAGRIAGVVRIPAGLATRIKRGEPGEVLLTVDGSNVLMARNVMKAVSSAVGTVGAGVQLAVAGKLGLRGDEALAAVIPIQVVEDTTWNAGANYTIYLVPGLLFFLLHIYLLTAVVSLFRPDGPRGAARRAGAVTGVILVSAAIGLIFLYGYFPRAGVVSSSSAGVVLALLLAFLITDALMAVAIATLVPQPLTALQMTIVIAMFSLMLSGITWPTDRFPPALARIAEAIPFTPFANAFQMFLHRPTRLAALFPHLQWLGFQALVFAAVGLAAGLVRRGLARFAQRRAA